MRTWIKYSIILLGLLCLYLPGTAQLSPGKLSNAHAHLEGLKKCKECHVPGEKETTSKCLDCHKEIEQLQIQDKGYHASLDVKGKQCASCHGEHFGREFEIVRFDTQKFDHQLAGYILTGAHKKNKCTDCHKPSMVRNTISQKKGQSYLGLGTTCLSCHDDVHQNTLGTECTSCHNQNSFKPATSFNHSKTSFPLVGHHLKTDCKACHKTRTKNGRSFQVFAGVASDNCTSCHKDVHNNKFGQDCRTCHDEFSFKQVKSLGSFNHEKTNFPLRGLHRDVDCKKCHTGSYTSSIRHKSCSDCHEDKHDNQILRKNKNSDCVDCHTLSGFSPSVYTIEKHNAGTFPLNGAHAATPCIECHLDGDSWDFGMNGNSCTGCHQDIHQGHISEKYLGEDNCQKCHNDKRWSDISFDHLQTNFKLEGAHIKASCRACHFPEKEGKAQQQFSGMISSCDNCHTDIHFGQFIIEEKNDCASCHSPENWSPGKFNHNKARFKLDGKHANLSCIKCHTPTDGLIQNYIQYKFEDISCASCH